MATKRQSIIQVKIEWTPGIAALKKIFPDDKLELKSAGRTRMLASIPFNADDLESFADAQTDVAACKAELAENGELHSFASRIVTVAPGTTFAVGDDEAD